MPAQSGSDYRSSCQGIPCICLPSLTGFVDRSCLNVLKPKKTQSNYSKNVIHLRSAHTRRPVCTLRANAHTVRMLTPSLASAVRMLTPWVGPHPPKPHPQGPPRDPPTPTPPFLRTEGRGGRGPSGPLGPFGGPFVRNESYSEC